MCSSTPVPGPATALERGRIPVRGGLGIAAIESRPCRFGSSSAREEAAADGSNYVGTYHTLYVAGAYPHGVPL